MTDHDERWKDVAEAEALLPAVRQLGDRRGEGDVLAFIGTSYLILGQVSEGIDALWQALTAYRTAEWTEGVEMALRYLGTALESTDHPSEAIPLLEEALPIARALGNGTAAIHEILSSLGIAYVETGKPDLALPHLEEALNRVHESSQNNEEIYALGMLATAYHGLDRIEDALACYEKALMIARELGDRDGQAYALRHLGHFSLYRLGQFEIGIDLLTQSLALFQSLKDHTNEVKTALVLGRAWVRAEQPSVAMPYFDLARGVAQKLGDTSLLEEVFSEAGVTHQQLSQPEEAIQAYQRALLLSQRSKKRQSRVDHLDKLGNLWQSQGDLDEAYFHYDEALTLARNSKDQLEEARQLQNLGITFEKMGEKATAIHFMKQALAHFQRLGNWLEEGGVCLFLGIGYKYRRQDMRCLAYLEMGRFLHTSTPGGVPLLFAEKIEEVQKRLGEHKVLRLEAASQRYVRWLHCQQYLQAMGDPLGLVVPGRPGSLLLVIGEQDRLALIRWGLLETWRMGEEAVQREAWSEAAEHFQVALRVVREHMPNSILTAHASAHVGDALARCGDLARGVEALEEAHNLFLSQADNENAFAILFHLASTYYCAACVLEAHECLADALATAREQGDNYRTGQALLAIGIIYRDYYEQRSMAKGFLEEALEAFQKSGTAREEGNVLVELGIVSTEMEHWKKAITYHQQALERFRTFGEGSCEARQSMVLACAFAVWGKFADADHWLQQAERAYDALEDVGHVARVRVLSGIIAFLQGNEAKCRGHLRAAHDFVVAGTTKEREMIQRWIDYFAATAP